MDPQTVAHELGHCLLKHPHENLQLAAVGTMSWQGRLLTMHHEMEAMQLEVLLPAM